MELFIGGEAESLSPLHNLFSIFSFLEIKKSPLAVFCALKIFRGEKRAYVSHMVDFFLFRSFLERKEGMNGRIFSSYDDLRRGENKKIIFLAHTHARILSLYLENISTFFSFFFFFVLSFCQTCWVQRGKKERKKRGCVNLARSQVQVSLSLAFMLTFFGLKKEEKGEPHFLSLPISEPSMGSVNIHVSKEKKTFDSLPDSICVMAPSGVKKKMCSLYYYRTRSIYEQRKRQSGAPL